MLRSEFDTLSKATRRPTDEEYNLIEFVYNWHPLNFSKETVASLYDEFGMVIFYDMEQRSKMVMEHDQAIINFDSQIKRLEEAKVDYVNNNNLFGRLETNG